MHFAKQLIQRGLGVFGLRLSRVPAEPHPARPIAPVHHRASVVFDVGANAGQYAAGLRAQGYAGRMVSFEPLPDAHEALQRRAAGDPGWTVHPRVALGASRGEVDLHVAGNSYSSSILPMLDAHVAALPESRYVGTTRTPMETLDSVAAQYFGADDRAYLKIDTQGYESNVLRGAEECVQRFLGVQLELSLVPLYEGQALYDEQLAYFAHRGFVLWDVEPVFHDEHTGRCLQLDAVFIRAELA
jgi:FkbM family methyltransferase